MRTFTEFDTTFPGMLYLAHVCYGFFGGILCYNLMIALFSDIISKVEERKVIEVTLNKLLTQFHLEEIMHLHPLWTKLYKRMTQRSLRRSFHSEKSRIYLVHGKIVKNSLNSHFKR